MIRAIGFDLDNTLFDHTQAAAEAMRMLIDQKGWTYSGSDSVANEWNRIERIYFPQYATGVMELMEHRRARMRDFLLSTDAQTDDHGLEGLWGDYIANYANCWVAYPDALPILKDLQAAGYKLAVLTNGQQEQQEAKLKAIGLSDLFEACLGIGIMEALKPDPRAFAQLCRVLECEPEEVIFVGDDVEADVRASTNAGLQGVWLNRDELPVPEGITHAIHTLSTLKNLL